MGPGAPRDNLSIPCPPGAMGANGPRPILFQVAALLPSQPRPQLTRAAPADEGSPMVGPEVGMCTGPVLASSLLVVDA